MNLSVMMTTDSDRRSLESHLHSISQLSLEERSGLKDKAHDELGSLCTRLYEEVKELKSRLREQQRKQDELRAERSRWRSRSRSTSPSRQSSRSNTSEAESNLKSQLRDSERSNRKLRDDYRAKDKESHDLDEKLKKSVTASQHFQEKNVFLEEELEQMKELAKTREESIREEVTKNLQAEENMRQLEKQHSTSVQKYMNTVATLKAQCEGQKKDLDDSQQQVQEYQDQLTEMKKRIDDMEKEHSLSLQAKTDDHERRLNEVKEEIAVLKNNHEIEKKKLYDQGEAKAHQQGNIAKEFYKKKFERYKAEYRDEQRIRSEAPSDPRKKSQEKHQKSESCQLSNELSKQEKINQMLGKTVEENKGTIEELQQKLVSQQSRFSQGIRAALEILEKFKSERDQMKFDLENIKAELESSSNDIVCECRQKLARVSRSMSNATEKQLNTIISLQTELQKKKSDGEDLKQKQDELAEILLNLTREMNDRQMFIEVLKMKDVKHQEEAEVKHTKLQGELEGAKETIQNLKNTVSALREENDKLASEKRNVSVVKTEAKSHCDPEDIIRVYGLHLAQKEIEIGRLRTELSQTKSNISLTIAERLRAINSRHQAR